jgi:NO-binding membrane sensor protein with MHYT domain
MENSTIRAWLIGLGLGMTFLWILGLVNLANPDMVSSTVNLNASRWLTWLSFTAAVLSYLAAYVTDNRTSRRTVVNGTIALSSGIFAMWLIGLANGAFAFLSWWSFAFACAYAIVGAAAAVQKRDDEKRIDRYSRAA